VGWFASGPASLYGPTSGRGEIDDTTLDRADIHDVLGHVYLLNMLSVKDALNVHPLNCLRRFHAAIPSPMLNSRVAGRIHCPYPDQRGFHPFSGISVRGKAMGTKKSGLYPEGVARAHCNTL
jgi:hypothetical protein